MSAVFDTLIIEIRALEVATWPDVDGHGVWEVEDIKLVPWERITPPVGVIELPDMPIDTSGEWGTCNVVHKGQISLYWVGPTSGDNSLQRARAEAMRDALVVAAFTATQVLDVAEVTWSDDIPLNLTFAQKGYTQRACIVRANVIVIANEAT